ncbi:MAG: sulfotransferase domain-containing protein [Symploca sp. SIO1A3]|nr:sulfotransferase domain-containing protein [Symploca sp. SIO2C1]NER51251.1 sulfotransferase domain-containing protein [Symploca sp. SIO1A3]
MKLPNFIIIGAAKSGTTTIYQYLCRHPQIYMSTPKEPDFFAIDEVYGRGMDWYSSLFSEAKPDQICGEASTTYSRLHKHPKAAERLAQAVPDAKLIYIMRHPVDRAYSFYVHRLKGARHKPEFAVGKTFEETIEQQSEFVDSSYYLFQIEKYLKLYPRESFLFLLMEDLIEKPAETMNKIVSFIGADPGIDVTQEGKVVANKAGDYSEWFVRQQLTAPLKAIPGVKLATSLFPKEIRDRIYQGLKSWKYKGWVKEQYVPPPMLPETRQMLLEKFREPNQQLAEFLNRDLSHWDK